MSDSPTLFIMKTNWDIPKVLMTANLPINERFRFDHCANILLAASILPFQLRSIYLAGVKWLKCTPKILIVVLNWMGMSPRSIGLPLVDMAKHLLKFKCKSENIENSRRWANALFKSSVFFQIKRCVIGVLFYLLCALTSVGVKSYYLLILDNFLSKQLHRQYE